MKREENRGEGEEFFHKKVVRFLLALFLSLTFLMFYTLALILQALLCILNTPTLINLNDLFSVVM